MATAPDLPEPDRIEGAPHPRETPALFGQDAAEREFLDAFNRGRLHHAWMLTGARGIGKATLAWRIARFLLEQPMEPEAAGLFGAPEPPAALDSDAEGPLARRIRAMAEPRLHLLRRTPNDKATALSQFITVDDVRKMKSFFTLSSADGGRRVAIVDSVDEMNTASANALLKLLEEPPKGAIFLLVSHLPARLLPTIRSRCRVLRLAPLGPEALSDALTLAGGAIEEEARAPLAELASGSVGEAFRLTNLEGLESYQRLVRLLATCPGLDRAAALGMASSAAGRGQEERFDLMLTQLDLLLARLSRAAVRRETPPEAAAGEAALFARLAPDSHSGRHWATLAQGLTARARQGRAVNLDPAALLMDILLTIDATASQLATGRI